MTNPLVFLNHQVAAPASALPPVVRPGTATRVTVNEMGSATGAPNQGQTFDSPFRPALSGNGLTFRVGTVQSLAGAAPIIPSITVGGKLVPMIDPTTGAPARLDLSKVSPNADGVSWAVLQVTPDETAGPTFGELLATSKCEIIHTISPISHALTFGRCPLTMILWKNKSPFRVIAEVYFNLRYLRVLPTPGAQGATKHLFF